MLYHDKNRRVQILWNENFCAMLLLLFLLKKVDICDVIIKKYYFCTSICDGALAQLARAFDWQSRGREFDSHTLHKSISSTCSFASAFFESNLSFLEICVRDRSGYERLFSA